MTSKLTTPLTRSTPSPHRIFCSGRAALLLAPAHLTVRGLIVPRMQEAGA